MVFQGELSEKAIYFQAYKLYDLFLAHEIRYNKNCKFMKASKIYKKAIIAGLGMLFLFHGAAYATDFTSGNFVVKDPVIEEGAGYATSSSYRMWSSIGQIAVGTSAAASFRLNSGFLYFSVPSESAPPAESPGQVTVPIGGAGFLGIIKKLLSPKKEPSEPVLFSRFDLSGDGTVGMADLSILLYFFEKPPSVFVSLPPQRKNPDFNGDGIVNFVDASILLFYWV